MPSNTHTELEDNLREIAVALLTLRGGLPLRENERDLYNPEGFPTVFVTENFFPQSNVVHDTVAVLTSNGEMFVLSNSDPFTQHLNNIHEQGWSANLGSTTDFVVSFFGGYVPVEYIPPFVAQAA